MESKEVKMFLFTVPLPNF